MTSEPTKSEIVHVAIPLGVAGLLSIVTFYLSGPLSGPAAYVLYGGGFVVPFVGLAITVGRFRRLSKRYR